MERVASFVCHTATPQGIPLLNETRIKYNPKIKVTKNN